MERIVVYPLLPTLMLYSVVLCTESTVACGIDEAAVLGGGA
jgi:hypothetical protein